MSEPASSESQVERGRHSLGESRSQRRLAMLELELRRLERRAEQAEGALAAIEASTVWRLSLPLRRALSGLKRFKQRLGLRLTQTRLGQRLYGLIRGNPAASTAIVKVDKGRFLADATQRFESFLASAERLALPAAPEPELSIVLVFYNQAPLSLDCLRSIVACCDVPAEVVIVDNASSDGTAQLLDRLDGACLIRNDDNRGFVEAVNQAAASARGRHLLLLNNDAELLPGSIRAAMATLDADQRTGAVGGRIVLLDGSLQEAGSMIWQDGSCLGYGRGDDPDQPEYMFRREVDYCSGAFLLTPRLLFEQLGGFDLAYAPAYYEESDYCVRLRQAGYRVVYEPAAVIRHFEFASSGGLSGASKLQSAHREIFVQRHPDFLAGQFAPDPGHVLQARSLNPGKRLLLIDDRVPHVQLGSGYPRCNDLIHSLVALGFEVTLYPLDSIFDDWTAVYRSLPREVEVMLGHGVLGLAGFLSQRHDYYDQVVISRPHNMQLVRSALDGDLSAFGRARVVYDAEAVIAPREMARQRLLGAQIDASAEAASLRAEIELAESVDAIVTVSEPEAELFRAAGHSRVDVLGHGVQAAPQAATFDDRHGFLFVGALRDDGSPNVDSLLWFINLVLPRLIDALGQDTVLYVVGDPSAPSLAAIDSDQIHLLGALDSLDLPFSVCRVFIAPTRFAAGIPHKVHAAAAGGMPVVATSLLAKQLGWQNESELLTADDADAFVHACLRLYREPALWQSVRDQALTAIQRDCSPESFQARVEAIFGRGRMAAE